MNANSLNRANATFGSNRNPGGGDGGGAFTARLPIQKSGSIVQWRFSVINFGADPTGVAPSGAAFNLALAAADAIGGGSVFVPDGEYDISDAQVLFDEYEGVVLDGQSFGGTRLNTGDPAFASILLDHTYKCGVRNLTVMADAPRTQGWAIVIDGGSATHTIGNATLTDCLITNVHYVNQFDHLQILDTDPGFPGGAWEVRVQGSEVRSPAAGGIGFELASPRGGVHHIHDVFFVGNVGLQAVRPFSPLHIQNSLDWTIEEFSSILCQWGCLIDPATGVVEAGSMRRCFFDSNSLVGIQINPAIGATVHGLELNNIWTASNVHNINVVAGVSGGGAGVVHDINYAGCQNYLSTGYGFILGGGTRMTLNHSRYSGTDPANAAIYLTANAARIQIDHNLMTDDFAGGAFPTRGLVIDAGCTDLDYNDNDWSGCTGTKVTDAANASKLNLRYLRGGTARIVTDIGATFTYSADPGRLILVGVGNEVDPMRYPVSQRLMRRLRVTALLGSGGASFTVTLYKNGVATAMVCTVPAGQAANSKFADDTTTTHLVLFADDDDYDVRVDHVATAEEEQWPISWSLEYVSGIFS